MLVKTATSALRELPLASFLITSFFIPFVNGNLRFSSSGRLPDLPSSASKTRLYYCVPGPPSPALPPPPTRLPLPLTTISLTLIGSIQEVKSAAEMLPLTGKTRMDDDDAFKHPCSLLKCNLTKAVWFNWIDVRVQDGVYSFSTWCFLFLTSFCLWFSGFVFLLFVDTKQPVVFFLLEKQKTIERLLKVWI